METPNKSALGNSAEVDSLVVDTGPPTRNKPRVTYYSTRSLWILLLVILISGGYFGYSIVLTNYIHSSDPNRALYQDLTVTYGPGDVVHPLIDANQTFDIIATVWTHENPQRMLRKMARLCGTIHRLWSRRRSLRRLSFVVCDFEIRMSRPLYNFGY